MTAIDGRHAHEPNPIAEQLMRLEASLRGDNFERYPRKVRLAILVGAPTALWILIGLAVLGLRALV
jgi:hypothetical protein